LSWLFLSEKSDFVRPINTAAAVLSGLVDLDLFEKFKEGREWINRIKTKEEIMHGWGLDR